MNRKPRCACLRAPDARSADSLLVALGLLMAWAQPLAADVIDDFSNGRKFIMHGQVANPDWLPLLNLEKKYRLQFCAVGSRFALALFALDDLETPVATSQRVDSRIPKGLSALGGRRSRSGKELYDVTIDRFLMNGVIP